MEGALVEGKRGGIAQVSAAQIEQESGAGLETEEDVLYQG